ncbi:hypothetical protein QVD17_36835 [Tagetes erecta]|uniref:Gibberellin regulated protein n=1 Tax=Tagetes erecta TaxID=13708 RepID=A0AAD8JT14_TARER|nr:hypothetical protein QVD17_36835 [Tagetes erecta]
MKTNHLLFSLVLMITTLLLFTSPITGIDTTIAPALAPVSTAPSPAPSALIGCDEKCEKRCAKAGYNERCLKYCGICCGKCNGCVPSSPYADKAECPCYRDLKNSKGKDKCP